MGKMTNKIPPLVGFEKCEKLNCWEGRSPSRKFCQNHISQLEDSCSRVLWKISQRCLEANRAKEWMKYKQECAGLETIPASDFITKLREDFRIKIAEKE